MATGIEDHKNFREVEIKRKRKGKSVWQLTEFSNLKKNNVFRFYKCDGTEYKAISSLYETTGGILKIDVV